MGEKKGHVNRQVVNRVRPSVRHKYVQAAAERTIELKLQRVIRGTGSLAEFNGSNSIWSRANSSPSYEAASQSANVSRRKGLLTDGLLHRKVPLPRVWELIILRDPERRIFRGQRESKWSR